MAGVVEWIKAFAVSLGGPGLFIIAFLDSSFLSFPEVNDLLIIWLTTQHKERMVYYAAMTTLGSVAGCLFALHPGPQGRRSVSEKAVQPAVSRAGDGHLPPLRPAGDPDSVDPPAADTLQDFCARGRRGEGPAPALHSRHRNRQGLQVLGEGLLAVYYGDHAADFLNENAHIVALVVGTAALVFGVAWIVAKRWRERSAV